MIRKKRRKDCATLNYIEHLLILASVVTGCVSISAFTSLVGVTVGVTSSPAGLNTCALTARIEKYKSINKKKEKRHDKIVFLAKT